MFGYVRYQSDDRYCWRVVAAMRRAGFHSAAESLPYRWDDYSSRDVMVITKAWKVE